MTIRRALIISLLILVFSGSSQNFGGTYKIHELLERISRPDTHYVVNFWATWCKPCIEELPAFDSLLDITGTSPVKILLVSLDFKEDLEKKVKPFLRSHQVRSECVLLDEINGNDFVNKISVAWSGAIPATLFINGTERRLAEKKMRLAGLLEHLEGIKR